MEFVVEGEGVGVIEGVKEGLSEALAKTFTELDGLGEGKAEGDIVIAWPNTSGAFSSTIARSGNKIDLKNSPEPSKAATNSPVRYKLVFGSLIFFIYK